MNKMGNVTNRLPKLPTKGNALSPDDRKQTITPINKLTPSRLKGNNPPTCFVTDDHYRGIITFDLVDTDDYHNAYLVTYQMDPDIPEIKEREMLYYWKKPSNKNAHINELALIDIQNRWADGLVITRTNKWKHRIPNWIRNAIHHISGEDGKVVDFDETF